MKRVMSFDEIETGHYYWIQVGDTKMIRLVTVGDNWITLSHTSSQAIMLQSSGLNVEYTIYKY